MKATSVYVTGALALTALYCVSCGDQSRPVSRSYQSKDTLSYLATNADFVGVLSVLPSEPRRQRNRSLDKATIVEVFKGDEKVGATIAIRVGTASGRGYVLTEPNHQYLSFLKKEASVYVPLTDRSMAEIAEGYVFGIWNRKEKPEVEIQGEPIASASRALREILALGAGAPPAAPIRVTHEK